MWEGLLIKPQTQDNFDYSLKRRQNLPYRKPPGSNRTVCLTLWLILQVLYLKLFMNHQLLFNMKYA